MICLSLFQLFFSGEVKISEQKHVPKEGEEDSTTRRRKRREKAAPTEKKATTLLWFSQYEFDVAFLFNTISFVGGTAAPQGRQRKAAPPKKIWRRWPHHLRGERST